MTSTVQINGKISLLYVSARDFSWHLGYVRLERALVRAPGHVIVSHVIHPIAYIPHASLGSIYLPSHVVSELRLCNGQDGQKPCSR